MKYNHRSSQSNFDNTSLTLLTLIEEAKLAAQNLLDNFSQSPDFISDLQFTFGDRLEISSLQQAWKTKEITFPEINVVSRRDINNANGAFARDTNTIYLAQEFLQANQNNLNAITDVLLEEYGHYLDSQLNNTDATGDEGAIFAALVQGKNLGESEIQHLKDEDDSAVVVLDGEEVEIENNRFSEDGRYAVYLDNRRISIKDLQTGANFDTGYDIGYDKENTLSITPDGRYVLFVNDDRLISNSSSSLEFDNVYIYDRETENLDAVFYGKVYDITWIDYTSVSNDGRYVVYGGEDGHSTTNFNYIYDDYLLDRGTDERLTIPNAKNSVISGNGRFVTYENDSGVYIYDTATKQSERINHFGTKPQIDDNAKYVLYFDNGDLYLYNRTTKENEQINFNSEGIEVEVSTNSKSISNDYGLYSISNDGNHVAFKSNKGFHVRDTVNNILKDFDFNTVDFLENDIDITTNFDDDLYLELDYDGSSLYHNSRSSYFSDWGSKKFDLTLPESELQETIVEFSSSNFRISENGSDIIPVEIRRLSGNLSEEISLNIRPTDQGTAKKTFSENGDYKSFYKSITIPAYVSSIIVDFSSEIIEDNTFESDENFEIEIVEPVINNNFAVIGEESKASITIEDNDNSISFYKIAEFLAKDTAYKNWNSIERTNISLEDVYLSNTDSNDFYKDIFNGKKTFADNLDYVVDKIFADDEDVNDKGFDALGLKSNTGNAPILLLRGTEPTGEHLQDVFADGNWNGVGYKQFLKHKDELTNWLDNAKEETGLAPELIGHSLGGALAQWIAADYTGNQGKELTGVTTFNSPAINNVYNYFEVAGEYIFNLINPKAVSPVQGASIFDPEKVSFVDHYITSGDIVSLAGDDYVFGRYHLYDTEGGGLFDNHLAPVLVNRLSDANFDLYSEESLIQLERTKEIEKGTSDVISDEFFGYDDPDYGSLLEFYFPYRINVEPARKAGGATILKVIEIGEIAVRTPSKLISRIFGNSIETNGDSSLLNFSSENINLSFDLNQVRDITQQYLYNFAEETNAIDLLVLAFGDNYDRDIAQSLIDSWQINDFSDIPEANIVSSSEIADSNGAYQASTGSIFLSQEFISQNKDNPELIAEVFLEEIGHHVDTLIKENDSPGDEGAIFSALVREEQLSNEDYIALLNENDIKTLPPNEKIIEVLEQWDDLAWQMSEEWDEEAIESVSQWTDEDWEKTLEWTDEQWQKSTLFTQEQWQATISPDEPQMSLTEVHRFYQYEKGFHLYTADSNEISVIKQNSNSGELKYNYESEKYKVLVDDKDILTGEQIEGVEPIYRFFNTETGAHLYTMDENEKNYIQDKLDNYNFEGIKYYAFENEPQNMETIPVYRMLNTHSGAHLFSSDDNEINSIEQNLPHFSMENNGNPAFYVFEL